MTGKTESKPKPPGYREVEYDSCGNCGHSDLQASKCETWWECTKHNYFIGSDPWDWICDDWKGGRDD